MSGDPWRCAHCDQEYEPDERDRQRLQEGTYKHAAKLASRCPHCGEDNIHAIPQKYKARES